MHPFLVLEVTHVIFSSEHLGGPTAWALRTEGTSLGLGNGRETLLVHFKVPERRVTDQSK
jgi:hypothetical protein